MKANTYSSWRFLHPDLDRSQAGYSGLGLSPTGAIAMAKGDAVVRQALLLLLSTSPGERVMRPAYGCELRRLVFSPNDYTTAGLARHYVRRAIDRWEPRVGILKLDARPDPEVPTQLLIFLEYKVLASRRTDHLAFSLDLTGEAA